jgi:catechol 2,3-dioxygenase-like lactoylglutathione lyase family enzyme
VKILFIASIAVITNNSAESRKLFIDTLGLPLVGDEYLHSENIQGSKHFGIWPLSQAAEACFGTKQWPNDTTIPQLSIEFEVEGEANVQEAAEELESKGYKLLHKARKEPWGQTVARILTMEGAIVGISFAPSMHKND